MRAIHRPVAIAAASLIACGALGAATAASASAVPEARSSASKLLAPPTGAERLDAQKVKGVTYRRYEISGQTAKAVASFYAQAWKKAGFTVRSGSGGGGWGPWGGSGAGAQGSKGGQYLAVSAGGRKGGPTYFEVCFGMDKKLVNDCQNLVQDN